MFFFNLNNFLFVFLEGRRSQHGSQKRSRENSGNRMMSAGSRSLQSMPRQKLQQQQLPYIPTTTQQTNQIVCELEKIETAKSEETVKMEPEQQKQPTEKAIEQIQNSLCTIVEEYFSGQAKNEFTDELKKLVNGVIRPLAVRDLFNLMFEKTKKHRLASGELICHMFVEKIIRLEDYEAGLQQVLDGADDISIDVPKIWDYLAELLSSALVAQIICFETIFKAGTDLIIKGHGRKFLSSIIKFIDGDYGPKVVRNLWRNGNFGNFMNESEIEEFVKINVR